MDTKPRNRRISFISAPGIWADLKTYVNTADMYVGAERVTHVWAGELTEGEPGAAFRFSLEDGSHLDVKLEGDNVLEMLVDRINALRGGER